MSNEIIVALVTGSLTFAGVIVSNFSSNKKLVNDVKLETTKSQAVTETKIDALTREVREHNNFAKRMPVVEEKISSIEKRLSDLERK